MGCASSKVAAAPVTLSVPGGPVDNEWEIDLSQLRRKQLIGQGSFGEVFLGTFMGVPCAIKTILPKLQQQRKLVDQFVEEIALMSTLRHPNVVMFLGACTRPPNLCMVLEYCEHGSLHDFLKPNARHGIKISMSLIFRFALDIARGVWYLHRKCKVVQRDLKARNILVDKSLNAKVADFGLSRVLGDPENNMTAVGTPAWTAPEIIRGAPYTEKVDVYSFGIIMWELVSRREPYDGRKGVQVAYAAARGLRPEIPPSCPENYANLMKRCWANDPEDRPPFSQIFEELLEMKRAGDAEAALARSHGNIVRSRYSVTLPVAVAIGDEVEVAPTTPLAPDRRAGGKGARHAQEGAGVGPLSPGAGHDSMRHGDIGTIVYSPDGLVVGGSMMSMAPQQEHTAVEPDALSAAPETAAVGSPPGNAADSPGALGTTGAVTKAP